MAGFPQNLCRAIKKTVDAAEAEVDIDIPRSADFPAKVTLAVIPDKAILLLKELSGLELERDEGYWLLRGEGFVRGFVISPRDDGLLIGGIGMDAVLRVLGPDLHGRIERSATRESETKKAETGTRCVGFTIPYGRNKDCTMTITLSVPDAWDLQRRLSLPVWSNSFNLS